MSPSGRPKVSAKRKASGATIYAGPERRKPVLIIQHAQHEHPAAIRRALESQGIQTWWLHPYRGESFPEPREISGLISLGGPMGANDEDRHPWIIPEIELIRRCVEAGMPVAGICLGGQMMARAMGGKVERNHTAEVGWFPIEVLPEGRKDPIVGAAGGNPTVYHWHGDTFHLPPDAVLLARSQACPRQAYRIGERAYGFQFHPEADHQLVDEWLSIAGVEDEVVAEQEKHGTKTVQDVKTQLNIAPKGEKASIKITAGIGALFRRHPPSEEPCLDRAYFEALATHRTLLVIEFEGSHRKRVRLRGQIATLLTIPAGSFVIFREENTLLWPIRLEDIRKVTMAER